MSNGNILATGKVDVINNVNNNTKVLYIVIAEDPSAKGKVRSFVAAQKIVVTPTFLEVYGFEVNNEILAQIKSTETFEDAIELAKKGNSIENVKFPWHRIVRINEYKMLVK